MAKLIFYDDEHIYEVDGEEYPSVSEISRFASREIYGEVNQFNLDNACNRGSAVHKATEILDKYGSVECSEDIENYIRAYVSFRKDFGVKDYAYIEKPLANENLKYAGTIDRIYKIDETFINSAKTLCKETIELDYDGKVTKTKDEVDLSLMKDSFAIIDIKSSSVVQNVLALIQLNAYKESVEENKLGVVGALFILHLEKDGKYKLINVQIDNTLFNACLTLHNALKKKKRVKKEK